MRGPEFIPVKHSDVSTEGEIMGSVTINGQSARTFNTAKLVGVPFCPDMLQFKDIGAADNMRGRVVRAFFWLMRVWPV